MKTQLEFRLARRTLEETQINDEYMYRDLARRMVNEMPIDELHKLIKLTKIDPFSYVGESNNSRYIMDDYMRNIISNLINEDAILYKAEVNLP